MSTSSLRWCTECETHHWRNEACYPVWYVVPFESGYTLDDAWRIRARDARKAAEQFGDQWDCGGDYTIVSGGDIKVDVYDEDKDLSCRFIVTGEAVPQYTARAIKEERN